MEPWVVVTGGSKGIGRACVERLAVSGRPVANLDREPADTGGGERFIAVDLRDQAAITSAFDTLLAERPIAGLVNNAGRATAASLKQSTAEDLENLVAVNLTAPMLCAQAVMGSMRALGWGRIVNIASRALLGKENRTTYAATKGGLVSMTRVWALELAGDGITVNAIGPGPIATDLFREVNPEGSPQTERIISTIPVRRLGTPADVARAAAFFLEPDAGFITGQILYVCGGMTVGQAPA